MLFKEDKLARLDAETIRKSVGWYRWTHDLVEVTGADALEILEKIYVSSIGKVLPGKTKYTAMLDEKGEILFLFDHYFLSVVDCTFDSDPNLILSGHCNHNTFCCTGVFYKFLQLLKIVNA